MFRCQRRRQKPGIHLPSPANTPVVAVPAGLAAITTKEEELSCEINKLKEALAQLGEEYLGKQDQRVAAVRRGDKELARKLLGEMQEILRRMAAIQHHVPVLERQREELGWRMDAERRRRDETGEM